tara:strand:- start:276 stop:602 length:327 start_codon:yes stop_codon:yes gene_type:complete
MGKSKLSKVVDKLLEKTTIDEKVMNKLHEILDRTEIDDKIVEEYKEAVESGLIDKIKCYIKCYGGYLLALGAGCLFGVNGWWGLIFLVASGVWAYWATERNKNGYCKR